MMNVRAISSSIAWALVGLSFLSCAWSGRVTSSQGSPGVAPGNQCFDISSTCATSRDCCAQRCQNGYCEEQNGM
jgi:hypothetical protein